jgi:hypothetical protein
MNEDNIWVRLYPHADNFKPVQISGNSLSNILDHLAQKREKSPMQGFFWDRHLFATLSEMEQMLRHLKRNERRGVELLIVGICDLMPQDTTEEQRQNCSMQFRIDLLSAKEDIKAGGVVLVEQHRSYVPAGKIERTLLPNFRQLTGLDITSPGQLTLKTFQRKTGWITGNECPDLVDENGLDVTDKLRQAIQPIHYKEKNSNIVSWY